MGAPSQQQIDDAIAGGLARGEDEDAILDEVSTLTRLSDEELAAMGIGPAPERSEAVAQQTANSAKSARSARPTTARGVSIDVTKGASAMRQHCESEPPVTAQPEPEFAPVPVKPRHDGWTAERQRAFIQCLAETGCVSEACAEVGITPRSAYRLRERPDAKAFRLAWIHAQTQAATRLTAIAFERAVHGSSEQFYRDGVLVAERRKPSDRLLMFLLKHFDPVSFGWMEGTPVAPEITDPRRDAIDGLPKAVRKLRDVDRDACPVDPLSGAVLIHSPGAAA